MHQARTRRRVADARFGDPGSVYVFVRDANGWQRQAKLTAAPSGNSSGLGFSVALSGNTAIAGAFTPGLFSVPIPGRAFVFVRNGTSWSQDRELTPSGNRGFNDEFGYSVAISGDIALVGWPDDSGNFPIVRGTVRVFSRDGSTWMEQPMLSASSQADHDGFGSAVALSGDGNTVVVGAPRAQNSIGISYIFSRNQTGWIEYQLSPSDTEPQQAFGSSVGLDGETVMVGAPGVNGQSLINGSAYVYVRNGNVWNQQAKLAAADGATSDKFGCSVALSHDVALVGASGENISSFADVGSADFFQTGFGSLDAADQNHRWRRRF